MRVARFFLLRMWEIWRQTVTTALLLGGLGFPSLSFGFDLNAIIPSVDQICTSLDEKRGVTDLGFAIAPNESNPHTEEMFRREKEDRQTLRMLRRIALLSLLPAQYQLARILPSQEYAHFSSQKVREHFQKNHTSVETSLTLPLSCRQDEALVTMEEKLHASFAKVSSEPASLDRYVRSLVRAALLRERWMRVRGEEKREGAKLLFLKLMARGVSRSGSVASLRNDYQDYQVSSEPADQAIAQLESEYVLLRHRVEVRRPAPPSPLVGGPQRGMVTEKEEVGDLLVQRFRRDFPEKYASYMQEAPDHLAVLTQEEILSDSFALPTHRSGSLNEMGARDYVTLVERSQRELVTAIHVQAHEICLAGNELALYDNLVLPMLFSEDAKKSGVTSRGVCRARELAQAAQDSRQFMMIAGTVVVIGSTVVTLGASSSAGIALAAKAGISAATVAKVGVASGIVATSAGLFLTGFDALNLKPSARRAMVAQGLFQASLASLDSVQSAERELHWTMFGLVVGAAATPLDVFQSVRLFRSLRSSGALSKAATEVDETADVFRPSGRVRSARPQSRLDDLFPDLGRLRRELAICGF